MPTYRATLHTTEPRRQYPALVELSYRSTDPYTTSLYSTIKLFVPAPRNGEHLPAILLSFKNGKGDCLIRVTPDGLSLLIEALETFRVDPMVNSAFESAAINIAKYKELEQLAFPSHTQAPVD